MIEDVSSVPSDMTVVRVAAPVRQQVTDRLREALLQGRFKPGERLVERHLCDLTGASRASVREALRHLETEGLVIGIPQVGMVVAEVSLEDAKAIYAVRGVLEGLAAKLFTANASDAQREALREAAKELERTADPMESLAIKERFYEVLLAGAGSPIIPQVLKPLQSRVAALRVQSLSHEHRPEEAAREIQAIQTAIDAGDGDAAARAASYHVDQAASIIFGGTPENG
jgi:DNA-binding GntR family transcriptional regulator